MARLEYSELSVRFTTTPKETINSIPDCNDREPRARDGSRSTVNATIVPIAGVSTAINPVVR
jgi:hypothetical protein